MINIVVNGFYLFENFKKKNRGYKAVEWVQKFGKYQQRAFEAESYFKQKSTLINSLKP